jgi:hypothetical protein
MMLILWESLKKLKNTFEIKLSTSNAECYNENLK